MNDFPKMPDWMKPKRHDATKADQWRNDVQDSFELYAAKRPERDTLSPTIRIRLPNDYLAAGRLHCTCHPDEAPIPCQRLYAASKCIAAAKKPLLTIEEIMRCAVDMFKTSKAAEDVIRSNMLADAMFYGLVPLTPWQKRVARWKRRFERVLDAFAVLTGRKMAVDEDY